MITAIFIIAGIIAVLIALVLIVLGMRALSLGHSRADDYEEYDDGYDDDAEFDDAPARRPSNEARGATASSRRSPPPSNEERAAPSSSRARRRRSGAEGDTPRASRRGKSRRNAEWDDDSDDLAGNSFWSSLTADDDEFDAGEDHGAPRNTRADSTRAMRPVHDTDSARAPNDETRGAPAPEAPPALPAAHAEPDPEPGATIANPDIAMLASLGQGNNPTENDPPSAAPSQGSQGSARTVADPLNDPLGAYPARPAPAPEPPAPAPAQPSQPQPTQPAQPWAPAASAGTTPGRWNSTNPGRGSPDPLDTPGVPGGASPAGSSPYDTGSYARPTYDTGSWSSPYDTGSYARPTYDTGSWSSPYGTSPGATSPYDTGSHARTPYDSGGGATSPYDTGSYSRSRAPYDTGSYARPYLDTGPRLPGGDPLSDPSFSAGAQSGPEVGSPIWSSMETGSHQRPMPPTPGPPGVGSYGAGPVEQAPAAGGFPAPYDTGGLGRPPYDTGTHPPPAWQTEHPAAGPPATPAAPGYPASPYDPSPGMPAALYGHGTGAQPVPREQWGGAGGEPPLTPPGATFPGEPRNDTGAFGRPPYDTGAFSRAPYAHSEPQTGYPGVAGHAGAQGPASGPADLLGGSPPGPEQSGTYPAPAGGYRGTSGEWPSFRDVYPDGDPGPGSLPPYDPGGGYGNGHFR